MPVAGEEVVIERGAPIPTWFGVGGGAERLARPASIAEVRRCVEIDPHLRVLGDGANLLVDDDGVPELVVALTRPEMKAVRWEDGGRVIAGAGANLPRLVTEAVRRGLAGIEGLGGVPASLGGAVMMNAGGAFGQIGDVVACLHGVSREGGEVMLERSQIDFGYRRSGLGAIVVTSVELQLAPGDKDALRDRLLEVMAYKKRTQPMAEKSAGCCFKNPTLPREVAEGRGWVAPADGPRTENGACRVSAGKLIDLAGCKGLAVGGAMVSDWHANFFVVREGAGARDVIRLMDMVRSRVFDRFGVRLEPEVVVWGRS